MIQALYFRGARSSVPVTVEVAAGELRFTAGDEARALPLRAAELALGGDQNRYLVCTFRGGAEEEELYLDRMGLVEALEAGGTPPEVLSEVRGLVTEHRKRWVKTRTLILSVTVALLLAAVGLLLSARTILIASVPPSWEESLGQTVYQQMEPSLDHDVDPQLERFIEDLGQRLLAARPEQPYAFTFHVVRDPTVNAFAFPGGTVVVHTGLIAKAGSPEEVAGVVGHELSHVLARHTLRSAVDRLGMLAVLAALTGGGAEAIAELEAAVSLIGLKFSRDHEIESDVMGAHLLHDAGIDPTAMGAFFDRLAEEEGALRRSLEFLTTHPHSGDRSERLAKLVEALPDKEYRPIEVDWAELQRLAGAAE